MDNVDEAFRSPATADFPVHGAMLYDQVVAEPSFPIGVDPRVSSKLILKVQAAAIAHVMGLKSIDYALKRYAPRPRRISRSRLDHEMVGHLTGSIASFSRGFKTVGGIEESAGHFMAGLSLLRVNMAFEAVTLLAYQGFFREVCSVLRSILEQVAWCTSVRWEPMVTDSVLNRSGERCIAALKPIYPTSGRIYGFLSDIVHHHPHQHFFLALPKKEGERVGVYARTPDWKMSAMLLTLLMYDMFGIVTESLFEDEFPSKQFIKRDGIRTRRFTLLLTQRTLSRYHHQLSAEIAALMSHRE